MNVGIYDNNYELRSSYFSNFYLTEKIQIDNLNDEGSILDDKVIDKSNKLRDKISIV